jgi:hypothetical protein
VLLLVAIILTAACGQDPPPLHQAVIDQDEARVEALLEHGSDPTEIWQYTQPGHSGMQFDHTPSGSR